MVDPKVSGTSGTGDRKLLVRNRILGRRDMPTSVAKFSAK